MSEITFTEDAEREFWDKVTLAFATAANIGGPGAGTLEDDARYDARYADYLVLERRKRIGPTPPGTPPAVPAEVAKVLGVDLYGLDKCLYLCGLVPKVKMEKKAFGVFGDHINAIRAARAALGMDTKEQQP